MFSPTRSFIESPTRNFIRDKRRELKEKFDTGDSTIEIYVGSPKVQPLPQESPLPPFVTISTLTRKFVLPKEVATLSNMIRLMLEGVCSSFKEGNSGNVQILEVEDEILERVFRYCMNEWLLNSPSQTAKRAQSLPNEFRYNRVEFCVETPAEHVMDLLMASHFLDIPGLFLITCKMLAENIDRIDSLEGLPDDILQKIYMNLTPGNLLALESECSPSNPLNRLQGIPAKQEVWETLYARRDWHSDRDSFYESHYRYPWSHLLRIFGIRDPCPISVDLHSAVLDNSELQSESQLNWKFEYLQRDMQTRIDSFSSCTNIEEFLIDLEYAGKYIQMLKIPPSFIESLTPSPNINHDAEVDEQRKSVTGRGILPFTLAELLAKLPELRLLDISNWYLNEIELDEVLHTIPQKNLNLHSLLLSNVRLTDRMVRLLCKFLKRHPLLSLDLSENCMTGLGLTALSKVLCANHSLRCLSISSNNITNSGSRPSRPYTHWERYESRLNRGPQARVVISDSDNSEEESDLLRSVKQRNGFDSFLSSLKYNSNLVLLDIGYNSFHFTHLSPTCWENMRCNRTLKFFFAAGTKLLADDAHSMMFNGFFHLPSSLEFLNIAGCSLNPAEIESLAQALPHLSQLTALNLAGNALGVGVLPSLVHILDESNLSALDLSENQLRAVSANFCHALSRNQSLQYLSLTHNYLQSNVVPIVTAAVQRKVQNPLTLSLLANHISTPAFNQLKDLLNQNAGVVSVILGYEVM